MKSLRQCQTRTHCTFLPRRWNFINASISIPLILKRRRMQISGQSGTTSDLHSTNTADAHHYCFSSVWILRRRHAKSNKRRGVCASLKVLRARGFAACAGWLPTWQGKKVNPGVSLQKPRGTRRPSVRCVLHMYSLSMCVQSKEDGRKTCHFLPPSRSFSLFSPNKLPSVDVRRKAPALSLHCGANTRSCPFKFVMKVVEMRLQRASARRA